MNRRLQLREGKGEPMGKGKRDHLLSPIAYHVLSPEERWYLREYRNGSLKAAKEAAGAAYRPRSAETTIFQMDYVRCSEPSDYTKR